jgi:hypothetical protein
MALPAAAFRLPGLVAPQHGETACTTSRSYENQKVNSPEFLNFS